jgi:hypothetical protein
VNEQAATIMRENRARARRERERREGGGRSRVPVQVRANRANRTIVTESRRLLCSGVTHGHAAQASWAASRATAGDVSRLSQTTRPDSRLRCVTSLAGHAPAPSVMPVHMARLLHKSHRMDWRDSKGSDLEKVLPRFISQNIIKRLK